MPEQDLMEVMLASMKESMGEVRLSEGFDQKVSRAIVPQRQIGWRGVACVVVALLVCLVVLWGQGLSWSLILLAVAVPVALVWAFLPFEVRRSLQPEGRRDRT